MTFLPTPPPRNAPELFRPLAARLPNGLCWLRLIGSGVVVPLAARGHWTAVWSLVPLLLLSDWIDGLLARRLSAETRRGALLDTVADVAMYSAIVIVTLYYAPGTLDTYWRWFAVAIASYALHVAVCVAKFRRWPSYHTLLAKAGWLFVLVAVIGIVTHIAPWLTLVAAIAVTVTNLEGVFITFLLPAYRINVRSVFHILN